MVDDNNILSETTQIIDHGASETDTNTNEAVLSSITDQAQKSLFASEDLSGINEVDSKTDNNEVKKRKGRLSLPGKLMLFGFPALVAIGTVAGILYYNNTPEQRFIRSVNLGVRSLQELDYETAKAGFSSAIEIDNTDLEAYYGLMQAYAGLNDITGMMNTYESAYKLISENIGSYTEENKAVALEILRYVRRIYGNDIESEIKNTELVLALYPGNAEFKGILTDDYYICGLSHIDKKEYASGIEYLDKALVLTFDNEEIKSKRDKAVKDYISYAFDNENYDLVLELVKKYKDSVDGIDDDFINEEIAEIQRIKAEEKKNRDYMKIVFDTMATEDYDRMLEMYNSEECQKFLERMTREVYYYFPDDNSEKTGIGAACYNKDGKYYFYYGNYENGSREGAGITFMGYMNKYFICFDGTWVNDKPNGDGKQVVKSPYRNSKTDSLTTKTGYLIDGIWEGHVKMLNSGYAGLTFDLSYDSQNGIPTKDRTEEWIRETGYSRKNINISQKEFIYAFDSHEIGWDTYWVWNTSYYGKRIGTIGFGELW